MTRNIMNFSAKLTLLLFVSATSVTMMTACGESNQQSSELDGRRPYKEENRPGYQPKKSESQIESECKKHLRPSANKTVGVNPVDGIDEYRDCLRENGL